MDSIGNRMKAYENCYRFYLPKRQAVILRLDGKAFHHFTKGFARPYDEVFAQAMRETAKKLCENISGCKFCYTQSDEISLVLVDYENINTEPWFGNNLQKIVSVSASLATYYFSKMFLEAICQEREHIDTNNEKEYNLLNIHIDASIRRLPLFDSRAFIVPREEVINCLYWRQLDCVRNSIQLVGQANFSHKQLQNKSSNDIQEMLFQEKGINWSKYPQWFKNGIAIYKVLVNQKTPNGEIIKRRKWYIDLSTPMFSTNPDFINKHVIF